MAIPALLIPAIPAIKAAAIPALKFVGAIVAEKVIEEGVKYVYNKGKEVVATYKAGKEALSASEATKQAVGKYDPTSAKNHIGPQIPAVVINQNMKVSDNGKVYAPVTIGINNINGYSGARDYQNKAEEIQKLDKAAYEKVVSNAKDVSTNAKLENSEKQTNCIDKSIATDALKDILKTLVLPTPLLILDAAIKTAQVIIENKQTKEAVVADVAKNMPEIEKIQDGNKVYNIVRGDSLWKIANENDTTVAGLREANPWLNDRFSSDGSYALIHPGEKLNMPGSVESMVQQDLNVSKEDLARIADKNSSDANKTLAETNKAQDTKADDNNTATCGCGH